MLLGASFATLTPVQASQTVGVSLRLRAAGDHANGSALAENYGAALTDLLALTLLLSLP
jgi:hypothetical protein